MLWRAARWRARDENGEREEEAAYGERRLLTEDRKQCARRRVAPNRTVRRFFFPPVSTFTTFNREKKPLKKRTVYGHAACCRQPPVTGRIERHASAILPSNLGQFPPTSGRTE